MNGGLPLGRRMLGNWIPTQMVRASPQRSILIVGPTQSGKTSRLVIPFILKWEGPVLVTSVKNDVVEHTRMWRETQGPVLVINPALRSGATWNPLEDIDNFHDAFAITRELFFADHSSSAESQFWMSLAGRLCASLFAIATEQGRDVYDVMGWLDARLHGVPSARDEAVAAVLQGFLLMEPRTLDSVLTTATSVLSPWTLRQNLGDVRSTLRRNGTIYLCAPRLDHRRFEGIFRGAVRSVIDEQERSITSRRLLVVLDEAASIAPLADLDQMAATLSGSGVTLVSVFQDAAQIQHRWGTAARTLVNNHLYRIIFHGTVDPTTSELFPEIVPDLPAVARLRQSRRGSARLLGSSLAPMTIRSAPWFRTSLRRRVPQ